MQRAPMAVALIILSCAACATVEEASTDTRLLEAQKAFDEGGRLSEAGRYAEAIPLAERALGLREIVLGGNHPEVANCLDLLGNIHRLLADYVRAEPLYARALQIREDSLEENHPDVAESLNNLASLYHTQGRYTQAEPLYSRALKLAKRTLGESHPHVATVLNNLAFLYEDQGLSVRAEPLYMRALQIWEAALGENHPNVATALNNLAHLYKHQGLYARAEPLYARALQIREAAFGKNHSSVATALNNLASLYDSQGLYARAEPLYARALQIREATLGRNHPDVATSLNNLASLYKHQGLYARAEQLYVSAIQIREAALGKSHPSVATALNNLASLYHSQGHSVRAEPLYARALQIREAALSENHPDVAISLNSLALVRLTQHSLDAALPLFERALTASEQHLRQEIFGFSEKRLASFLEIRRSEEERLYALVRAHPGDPRVRHLALSAALLRKGRSAQEVADTSLIIYRNLGLAEHEAFERLRAVRTQLATLSLTRPRGLSLTVYQQRLKDLADTSNSLEVDLTRRSEPFRMLYALPHPAELISRVTSSLPSSGALVEFVAYQDRPFLPRPGLSPSQGDGGLRYLALLLFPDGSTRAVDLGLAAPIDRAVLRLHGMLARQSVSYQPAAQALYELAFRPLVPHLGKVRRLFLAPDGQLNLVPFAALHDGHRFLVDAFDITYLTSGKDLLPRSKDLPPARSVLVLADPDFSSPPAAPSPVARADTALTERSASLERFFSTLRSERADLPWTPLPGTRKEAEAIQRLFPQAQLLLGPDATKQALLKLSTPGVLHIATHGFFLEDAPSSPDSRAVSHFGAVSASPQAPPADPLLRSGLVLAGAPLSAASPGPRQAEDSLATALELAGLNLWGTQLVVLSACDTGRGDVKLGQGVYGLRRAFLVAGAETLVTSLWKVNDGTTHQLMEAYYRHLLAGLGRTAALREAMRELRRKRPHPHFWAPFIALGLDVPLRAQAMPGEVEK